jgi:amidase
MNSNDLVTGTIPQAARALRDHETTSVELTEAVLDRIDAHDGRLHAFNLVLRDAALASAESADAELADGKDRGPLHGIPLAVKDLCDLEGTATTCSSPVRADDVATADAPVVRELREAGAVIVGKTNMTEFALTGYHPDLAAPVNPWGDSRWPGLSSSGSGAAVAASMGFCAIGTDTGGSIRFPAAANGVVGLKPTYGRVSRDGIFPLSYTFDHVGPLTRSVEDAEIVLRAIAGHDAADPITLSTALGDFGASSPEGTRFGIDEAWIGRTASEQTAAAVAAAARRLEELGAVRVDVEVPQIEEALGAWLVICSVDALVAHAETYPAKVELYGPAFREHLEVGSAVTGAAYAEACMVRDGIRAAWNEVYRACDAVLMPALADVAGRLGEDRLNEMEQVLPSVEFSAPANFTGRPSLTLPCGFSADDMPIALQILGNPEDEATICALGRAYEGATDWHRKRPPLSA